MKVFNIVIGKICSVFIEGVYRFRCELLYPNGTTFTWDIGTIGELEAGGYVSGATLVCHNDDDSGKEAEITKIIPPNERIDITKYYPAICFGCGKRTLVRKDDEFVCTNHMCVTNAVVRLNKIAKHQKLKLFGGATGLTLCMTLRINSLGQLLNRIKDISSKGESLSEYEGIGKITESNLMELYHKAEKTNDIVAYLMFLQIPGMTKIRWEMLFDYVNLTMLCTYNKSNFAEVSFQVDPDTRDIVLDWLEVIQHEISERERLTPGWSE